jgi:hypothetical protein
MSNPYDPFTILEKRVAALEAKPKPATAADGVTAHAEAIAALEAALAAEKAK